LLNLTPDEFVKDPTVIRLIETGSPAERHRGRRLIYRADLTILGLTF
jgi:hypothetical protein